MDGLARTKDDIVKSQVTDLFKAKDFQDVIIRAYKVREKLEALGCFRRIGIYIDTSQGPEATPDGVEVGLYNYTLIQQRISNFRFKRIAICCHLHTSSRGTTYSFVTYIEYMFVAIRSPLRYAK